MSTAAIANSTVYILFQPMSTTHDGSINDAGAAAAAASASDSQAPAASSTPRPPPAPDSDAHVASTCSFCWQISPGKPHVIGQSARLACGPCYAALLDLAVCWVCGEVVVRGDDCVSLGWCFWHRVCYGCLLYGSKRVVKGAALDELYRVGEHDDASEGSTGTKEATDNGIIPFNRVEGEPGRGKGREIREVPLCANCLVEVEADSLGKDALAHKAVSRVARSDDVLARLRWEQSSECTEPANVTSEKNIGFEASSPSVVEMMLEPSGNGHSSEMRGYQAESDFDHDGPPIEPAVYVSLHDPFGANTYRPSPTKPIPKWMQDPPRRAIGPQNVFPEGGPGLEGDSLSLPNATSSPINWPSVSMTDRYDDETGLNVTQHVRETARASMSDSLSQDTEKQSGSPPLQYSRRLSLISDEPLMQPSSILGQYVRSDTKPPEKKGPKNTKSSSRLAILLSVRTAALAPPQITSPQQQGP